MLAKFVAAFQVIVLGSLFSLAVSVYCDGFMKHEKEIALSGKHSSCHEVEAETKDFNFGLNANTSKTNCPIWSSLESKESTQATNYQIVPPQIVELFWGTELLLLSERDFSPAASFFEPPIPFPIPIYLQNPTLRI
jgi:hypothetical protein